MERRAKRAKYSPKTQKSLLFLHQIIQIHQKKGMHRLPSISRMAQDAHVSVVTMHRAVELVKKEHLISASTGSGIWINDSIKDKFEKVFIELLQDNHKHDKIRQEHKFERVKGYILEDILNGTYHPGVQMPTQKELCIRYGTSAKIIKKAMESLAEDRKIIHYNRGYRVVDIPVKSHRTTIVVITLHNLIHQLASYSPFFKDFADNLVQQKQIYGFNVHLVPFFFLTNPDNPNYTTIRQIEEKHEPIGYIIGGISPSITKRILDMFRSNRTPVALLDFVGFIDDYPNYTGFPSLRIFVSCGVEQSIGRDIGNHLLLRGHRSIAYFTYAPEANWSKARYQGLQGALESQQLTTDITKFEVRPSSLDGSVPVLNESDVFETKIGELAERLYYQSQYIKPLQTRRVYREAMEPLFRQALHHPEITAWVGANDECILLGYFFLDRNGIKIADRIALVGVDNTYESFAYGITSYNFNCAAAIQAILQYIFSPSAVRLRERIPFVTIPGTLVEREIHQTGMV